MFVADEVELVLPPFPPPPVLTAFDSSTAVPSTTSNAGDSAPAIGTRTNSKASGMSASQRQARKNPGILNPRKGGEIRVVWYARLQDARRFFRACSLVKPLRVGTRRRRPHVRSPRARQPSLSAAPPRLRLSGLAGAARRGAARRRRSPRRRRALERRARGRGEDARRCAVPAAARSCGRGRPARARRSPLRADGARRGTAQRRTGQRPRLGAD